LQLETLMNAPQMSALTASRAARVQHVVSKAGLEAWLVEDYAVPLVAMEFALEGGSTQDPDGRMGAASMMSGLMDEGAGDLDARELQHVDQVVGRRRAARLDARPPRPRSGT
jgi:predicted Zn-dependent peptidase